MLDMKQNTVVEGRRIKIATMRDEALGPLKLLPGTWANILPDQRDGSNFKGTGTLEGAGQSP
ncbi:MAG: hypothetical protein HKN27_15875, partial [Silicimonas sp.]|nr:hypothetical protein [Silicimonas sp.]